MRHRHTANPRKGFFSTPDLSAEVQLDGSATLDVVYL
jgi:hypothetical protein